MSHRNFFLASIAGLGLAGALLQAPRAQAADLDLDPGYASVPVQAEQKVEFGSGWYVRGDMGATQDYAVDIARNSLDSEAFGAHHTHIAGYDLSLGGGYSFTNGIRADLIGDFHQPATTQNINQSCITPNATTGVVPTTCSTVGKFAGYDALANAYYDFGTWYHLTPYVGGGVGVAFGALSATLTGDSAGTYYAKYQYHNLAWALMAGVSLDVYDHTKLDIGYRYLSNGTVGSTNVYFHEIRAGLRYMIDN